MGIFYSPRLITLIEHKSIKKVLKKLHYGKKTRSKMTDVLKIKENKSIINIIYKNKTATIAFHHFHTVIIIFFICNT